MTATTEGKARTKPAGAGFSGSNFTGRATIQTCDYGVQDERKVQKRQLI
jgi:hypothetical protein